MSRLCTNSLRQASPYCSQQLATARSTMCKLTFKVHFFVLTATLIFDKLIAGVDTSHARVVASYNFGRGHIKYFSFFDHHFTVSASLAPAQVDASSTVLLSLHLTSTTLSSFRERERK